MENSKRESERIGSQKNGEHWTGEVGQRLRTHVVHAQDPSQVPSAHVRRLKPAVTQAPEGQTLSSGLCGHLHPHDHTHTQTHMHTHKYTLLKMKINPPEKKGEL